MRLCWHVAPKVDVVRRQRTRHQTHHRKKRERKAAPHNRRKRKQHRPQKSERKLPKGGGGGIQQRERNWSLKGLQRDEGCWCKCSFKCFFEGLETFCVAGIGIDLFFAKKLGQERALGTIWNARTSSCLVIPTLLYCTNVLAHKKQPSRIWPERTPRFVFSGVFGFCAFWWWRICICFDLYFCILRSYFASFIFCACCCVRFFCARASLCNCFFCARANVCIFAFVGGPASRVNPGDATPIVQSRPACKSNKQTQTGKRGTSTQRKNSVDFSFPSAVGPYKPCAQGEQRTTYYH